MKRIVILASGSGTNAENIIKYFQKSNVIAITQVLSNKKDAKVLERAKRLNVSNFSFDRDDFFRSEKVLDILKKEADYIVLAGFLWKIPENIIETFSDKIINIHPALLPKYGGKGMYGENVHKAVVLNKEQETGITIHLVNENYDEGAIIFQAKVAVAKDDTSDDVAKKIHELEYEHFPRVIEEVILKDKV
ncbi:phosphoribosylglycinamide formyltransferase [Aureibaculum sp. A20]|uniref:Phosphoribosylglycinamide formyltransferase n=1 Tax=Aureibaculum flavum TaxID=2795986 RepID=A0ABS0WW12_9FLAO|nr:phosphoribosylglycinamide formyltransferase [Aureibaculum flavum]MBJ2176172.1 phosphoribosylglycinamide formyltransferase [Aureibaculum flavum]